MINIFPLKFLKVWASSWNSICLWLINIFSCSTVFSFVLWLQQTWYNTNSFDIYQNLSRGMYFKILSHTKVPRNENLDIHNKSSQFSRHKILKKGREKLETFQIFHKNLKIEEVSTRKSRLNGGTKEMR